MRALLKKREGIEPEEFREREKIRTEAEMASHSFRKITQSEGETQGYQDRKAKMPVLV